MMMSDVEMPSVRFVSLNFPIAFTCIDTKIRHSITRSSEFIDAQMTVGRFFLRDQQELPPTAYKYIINRLKKEIERS